ncbi:hypothetical protein Scep_027575 [Stephania cephalantha]|uniref:Uncharacterized protein n=1 Tax=Stephania cephalantha TaxID=152367 RepID=A0AAP0EFP6_9MAGN
MGERCRPREAEQRIAVAPSVPQKKKKNIYTLLPPSQRNPKLGFICDTCAEEDLVLVGACCKSRTRGRHGLGDQTSRCDVARYDWMRQTARDTD